MGALLPTTIHTVETARLSAADPGTSYAAIDVDDSGWIEAAVPGDVRAALHAAGRIGDSNRDVSPTPDAWVDEKEWWYRFELPHVAGDSLVLRFEGIDTFATIYVDGRVAAETANMFRTIEVDVTDAVAGPGPHVVAVHIKRPVDMVDGDLADRRTGPRSQMRKAQFGYGWDFAPNVPSIGLWRPVTLHHRRGTHIDSVRFQTLRLDADGTATVACDVFAPSGTAHVVLSSPDGDTVLDMTCAVADGVARGVAVIPHAQLWWPHNHGSPALHTLRVDLVHDGDVVDGRVLRVGIRTVSLDQSPDPDELGARYFRFVVNGRPISAKGANWVPCDMAVGAVPTDRYARLLRAAAEHNMNMIRIWGGGVYEHEAFYDACDELGLLVWQEFMFACVRYEDGDPAWLDDIRAEATDQVKRLRSRACLALWSGNNEVEVIQGADENGRSIGANIFYGVLPEVVAREDGVLDYIPTSPMMRDDQRDGDRHNWFVWHGLKAVLTADGQLPENLTEAMKAFGVGQTFDLDAPEGRAKAEAMSADQYLEDMSRFPSEFGLRSMPARATMAAFIDADQLALDSPQITDRNKDNNPTNKIELAASLVAGRMHDVDDMIDLSQLTQAEGLKLGVEHYRRRWPHCSGSLIWQFNDCWPGPTWSLIDYLGRPKGALAYAKRFYAPVLASFVREDDGAVSLWVINDTAEEVEDRLDVRLVRFAGGEIWASSVTVDVPPFSSTCCATWTDIESGPDRVLVVRGALVQGNRLFFVQPKDLEREPAKLVVDVASVDGHLAVTLTASSYALFAHVIVDDPSVRFDDNYIDLEAGERRTLTSLDPSSVTAEGVTVRSL